MDVTLLNILLFLFSYNQLMYGNKTTPDSTTNWINTKNQMLIIRKQDDRNNILVDSFLSS